MEPLSHRKEQVGVILRTKDRVEPVFVSQGHKISLKKAVEVVLACCTKRRWATLRFCPTYVLEGSKVMEAAGIEPGSDQHIPFPRSPASVKG